MIIIIMDLHCKYHSYDKFCLVIEYTTHIHWLASW